MPKAEIKKSKKTTEKKRKKIQPVALVIKEKEPLSTEVVVTKKEHSLSPFVLNLKNEVPETEGLEEQALKIRLNLLDEARMQTTPIIEPPKDALIITKKDIAWQLHDESEPPCIAQKTIEPVQTPKDILSYFDLPEEEPEDDDESELVEFTDHKELQYLDQASVESSHVSFSFSRFQLLRPIAAFVAISFIFVLPIHAMNLVSNLRQTKTHVTASSQQGLAYLASGSGEKTFTSAYERFSQAQASIDELGVGTSLLLSAIPITQKHLATGSALIAAAERLSIAGERFTQALTSIEEETDPTPVSRIRILQSYLRSALPHLNQANDLIAKIDPDDLPKEHQDTFSFVQTKLPAIVKTLSEFDGLSDLTIAILGGQETKRYLLVFQNNTEIRATGGFMGSFAELKVRDGIIEHFVVPGGGTYDLQGQLRNARIPPSPLQLLSARWEFQDANWFPDFPTSARQMITFYRDAGGPSVDGVIAINATYVADLIAMLGPIEMEAYGRTINAENFLFEAQKIVELEYDREQNKPKQFIGDLAPILLSRALEGGPERFLALMDALSKGLLQKDVQLYFTNEDIERSVLEHRWGGAVLPTSLDYLMVVNSNLGGGKTDGMIREDIDMRVDVDEDGSLTNTVTITRAHQGIKGAIFTGVNNVNYVRLYVPRGSELINADGFDIPDALLFESPEADWLLDNDLQYAELTRTKHPESQTDIYEEHGKTVFGNWVQTSPGESSTITFRYRLPLKIFEKRKTASPYSLTIQKQSGTINRKTNVSVSIPKSVKVIWQAQDLKDVIYHNETDALYSLLLKAE